MSSPLLELGSMLRVFTWFRLLEFGAQALKPNHLLGPAGVDLAWGTRKSVPSARPNNNLHHWHIKNDVFLRIAQKHRKL